MSEEQREINPISMEEAADLISNMGAGDDSHEQREQHEREPRPAPHPVAQPAPQTRAESAPRQPEVHLPVVERQLQADAAAHDEKWKATNWQRLRDEDPGEWAAQRNEYLDERRELQARLHEIQSAKQAEVVSHQSRQAQAHQQRLETEKARLMQSAPELGEEANRRALVQHLMAQGFSTDEINSVADHRVFLMAWRAMQYERGESRTSRVRVRGAKPRPPSDRDVVDAIAEKRGIHKNSTDYAALRIARMGIV